MKMFRKNDGFTLVELIVTIVVGSIATMAAATVLILGLRIYNNANETALKQNEVNIGITVIENLVAENPVVGVSVTGQNAWSLSTYPVDEKGDISGPTTPLLSYSQPILQTGANVEILHGISACDVILDYTNNLVSFKITIDDEQYDLSVYCREGVSETAPLSGMASVNTFSLSRTPDAETVLTSAVEDDKLTPHVRTLLKTLASQQESTGRIQTGDGEGEYYSEWYIGGYGENSDWNSSTPWCACFVSWALEQCGGYLEGETPRYANVDTFCTELVTSGNWKADRPEAGDLIFFDWTADGDYDPAHIGVVIGANENRVYTIEGNVNGRVALCDYALDDDRILGYGELNWTK